MLRTVMRSLTPLTRGRRQQIPRTIKSIGTPACDARQRAAMICRVRQRVHLGDDARRQPLFRVGRFALDQGDHALVQFKRGDQQFLAFPETGRCRSAD